MLGTAVNLYLHNMSSPVGGVTGAHDPGQYTADGDSSTSVNHRSAYTKDASPWTDHSTPHAHLTERHLPAPYHDVTSDEAQIYNSTRYEVLNAPVGNLSVGWGQAHPGDGDKVGGGWEVEGRTFLDVVTDNHIPSTIRHQFLSEASQVNAREFLCNNSEVLFGELLNLTWVNCSNFNSTEEPEITYNHPVLGVLLTCFALVTILGNLLVFIAVARERYLRTVTNYFIVSLALADLIIGGVVMPFSISMEMTHNVWFFGSDWCDVWHSIDVLASSASILNLSMISLDRYWAITDPIAYPSKMSTGRAFILIALVWICSAAISFPAILWWRAVQKEPVPLHVCAFTDDTAYLIFSSMVSFYCPMSVILFAYYKIYVAATEQTRSLKTGSKVMSADGANGEVMTLRIHRGGGAGRPSTEVTYARAANSDSDGESPAHYTRDVHYHEVPNHHHGGSRPSRMISRKWKNFAISRKLSKLAKEQKAAKTLGIVMGIFCLCWVPFFVTNVLYGICKGDCVRHADIVFPVFTWLGYINSGMNPVIYACSMRDFRRAFTKIVCCCCPGYIRFRTRRQYCDSNISTSTSMVVNYGDRYSNVRL